MLQNRVYAIHFEGCVASQTLQVVGTFVPGQWDGNAANGYDIAILKLERKSCMEPVPLAKQGFEVPTVGSIVLLGYGRLDKVGGFSDVLVAANMSHVPTDACNTNFVINTSVTEEMLCARGETTAGLCAGMSTTADLQFIFVKICHYPQFIRIGPWVV